MINLEKMYSHIKGTDDIIFSKVMEFFIEALVMDCLYSKKDLGVSDWKRYNEHIIDFTNDTGLDIELDSELYIVKLTYHAADNSEFDITNNETITEYLHELIN